MSIEIKIGCLQTNAAITSEQLAHAIQTDLIGEIPDSAELLDLGELNPELEGKKGRIGPDFVKCEDFPRCFELLVLVREVTPDGKPIEPTEPSGASGVCCGGSKAVGG